MAWLLRKSATLIAVYSIALQALLVGFVSAGHFGLDPFAIICTGDDSGDHQPALRNTRATAMHAWPHAAAHRLSFPQMRRSRQSSFRRRRAV
jgi:hypothetical protein